MAGRVARAAAARSAAVNSFWPAGAPFPPGAPWLAASITRESALAAVSRLPALSRSASTDAMTEDEKRTALETAVAAFNQSHDASACAGFDSLVMMALAYLVCYGTCDELGGEVTEYDFDTDSCQITACRCEGTSVTGFDPEPIPRPSPGSFSWNDEDWDYDNWSW